MNWLQLIERRHSVRHYASEIDEATLAQVRDICQRLETFNSCPLELRLLPGTEVHQALRGYLGAYGRVISPWYIAVLAPGEKDSLLNIGYSCQRVILEMTALNLGTCWIGGMYKKESLEESLNLERDKGIRTLIAWGRPSQAGKDSGRQGKRLAPEKIAVFDGDQTTSRYPWRAVLEAVRWAPSAINRQPWRLWFTAKAVHVFSVAKRIGRKFTPIDMGIALCHLELACKQLAIAGKISQVPHPVRKGWEYWASFAVD